MVGVTCGGGGRYWW